MSSKLKVFGEQLCRTCKRIGEQVRYSIARGLFSFSNSIIRLSHWNNADEFTLLFSSNRTHTEPHMFQQNFCFLTQFNDSSNFISFGFAYPLWSGMRQDQLEVDSKQSGCNLDIRMKRRWIKKTNIPYLNLIFCTLLLSWNKTTKIDHTFSLFLWF